MEDTMNTRMSVQDRFENDPLFKATVDLFTTYLMSHPEMTPTELREAVMCAAMRVEAMTMRDLIFSRDGTYIGSRYRKEPLNP